MIGVEAVDKLPVLRAKLIEIEAELQSLRASIGLFVQNMTVSVTGSGFATVTQPDEPPHPTSGTIIWIRERAGQATVFYINGVRSNGAKTWQWLAETP